MNSEDRSQREPFEIIKIIFFSFTARRTNSKQIENRLGAQFLPVNVPISSVCVLLLAFGEDSRSVMVLLMANSALGGE